MPKRSPTLNVPGGDRVTTANLQRRLGDSGAVRAGNRLSTSRGSHIRSITKRHGGRTSPAHAQSWLPLPTGASRRRPRVQRVVRRSRAAARSRHRRASSLIIVSDSVLSRAPFAALLDSATGGAWSNNFQFNCASANSLRDATSPRSLSVAGIALLLAKKQRSYLKRKKSWLRSRRCIAAQKASRPRALHGLRSRTQPRPPTSSTSRVTRNDNKAKVIRRALRRQGGVGVDRVSWKTVVSTPRFHARVIVLAACETLRPPPSSETRALSSALHFQVAGLT